jgi:NAD(P)H-quinone oxidoreductase subunit K
MKTVDPILTGTYLASGTREAPPKELMAAMGMPVALDEVKADAKEGAMAKPSKGIADGLDKGDKT